ncbi:MAG: ester cyclase [Candidatus Korobacteraceae bacterium]
MRKLALSITALLIGAVLAGQQPSVQETNKAVTQSFFEQVLDQGQLDHYADSHVSTFVAHGDGRDYTLAEDIAAAKDERTALPDMRVKVNQMVAERDLVSVFWTATGTNTHAGMGFPATGKRITINGMTLFRLRDGKIVEEWSVFDMLSAMRQAGLLAAQ